MFFKKDRGNDCAEVFVRYKQAVYVNCHITSFLGFRGVVADAAAIAP